MFIQKVRGNVKLGCDVELGEKTLVVGRNGSGKSTVVNAIELALTGRASDIAGRVDVGREADVMSLATNGASELEALAEFSDGVVAAYRTSGSTAKAKKATGDKPSDRCHDEVLPIRSLREAVLGSAVTARKYLLGKVSGAVTRGDIAAMLPAQALPAWEALTGAMAADLPISDVLVTALETAGKQQRSAADEAKAARSAAKMVSGSYATPPAEAEIREAQKVVLAAQAAYLLADRQASAAQRHEALKVKAADTIARHTAATATLATAEEALAAAPPAGNAGVLVDAVRVNQASAEFGACLVCGGDAGALAGQRRELEAAIATTKAAMAARSQAEAAVASARATVKSLSEQVEREALDLETIESQWEPSAPSVSESSAALEAARKRLSDLEGARDSWSIVQRSESQALDAERRVAEWRLVKEALESVIGSVLDKALAGFVAAVQSRLPAGDVFDLRLRDGDREVVAFGLVRDGVLHTALSGAEWARVMAAMAEACVPEGQYACVIPEERAFDPATLSAVCKALSGCRHQVVLTSPVAPKPVPKGWVIVKRGEE